MAELTWRNIDAPNIDVRNLAIAGNSIGDAFSNFSKVLADRAATQKTDATNAALAGVLTAQNSDDALAAFKAAQGSGNKNIDLLQLAKGYNDQYATLQDRYTKDDAINNLKAETAFGAMLPELQQAYYAGDQNKVTALSDALASDPLYGRFASKHIADWMTSLHQGVGDRQGQATIDETARNDRANNAVSAMNARTQASEVASTNQLRTDQHLEAVKMRTDRAATDAGASFGARYFDALPAQYKSSADTLIVKDPHFLALSKEGQAGVLAGIKTRGDQIFKDNRFNTNTNDALGVNATAATGNSNADIAQTLLDDHTTRNNPALMTYKKSLAPEYQNLKLPDVIKTYETKTGIQNPAGYIEDLQKQGMSLAEIAAMPDVVDMQDRGFNPWEVPISILSGFGAAQSDGFGSNVAGFDLTSGTNRANAVVKGMEALRKPGGLAAANADYNVTATPIATARAQLTAAAAQARSEYQANGGKVSAETKRQLDAMNKKLQDMVDAQRAKDKAEQK